MVRLSVACFVVSALVASPAVAAPNFSGGAVSLGLQYGPSAWALDAAQLGRQVGQGNADTFIAQAQGSHTGTLRLGYNILGHATVEAALTATGWNLGSVSRGGGGFLAGLVHWHPLEL